MAAAAALEKVVPVDGALEMFLDVARPLESVTVPLYEPLNRILAEEIRAPDPLPPYPASVKDGYAVVPADGPGEYPVISESRVGNDGLGVCVTPGTVAYVTTGDEMKGNKSPSRRFTAALRIKGRCQPNKLS